jgi:hypothetical protein
MYEFLTSPMRSTCPVHLNILDLIIVIIFWRIMKQFYPGSCYSSLLSLNILLSTLFSNTLNLFPSINVRHKFDTRTLISFDENNLHT